MYHPKVVDARLSKLATLQRRKDPTFTFVEHSIDEVENWVADLDDLWDVENQKLRRALKPAEQRFIAHEVLRNKADYRYWLTRYCKVKTKHQTLERVKVWDSQELILDRVAKAELGSIHGQTGDGIVLALLKARQLGASTLTESMLSHRAIFYGNVTALIAAHIPEQAAYLFDMTERIYENLPWWMRPKLTYHVKDQQMFFGEQDSLILTAAALSTAGGDSGQRGAMGTGKTLGLVHLSELALWQNPYQIDDSLMPSIPESPNTLAIFESTAKGRGNWWHVTWNKATKGLSRLQPVFIPWYAEPQTYTRPAPADWAPSDVAKVHAINVLEDSPRWFGKTIHLTRDQLYWWERKRAEYVESNTLNKFLAEYCSKPEEAFQHTTQSVFPQEVLQSLSANARPLVALAEITPRTHLKDRGEANAL